MNIQNIHTLRTKFTKKKTQSKVNYFESYTVKNVDICKSVIESILFLNNNYIIIENMICSILSNINLLNIL